MSSLFDIPCIKLDIPDADFFYYPDFLGCEESAKLYTFLRANVQWEQQYAKFPTTQTAIPRLTQWFGDKSYFYSGILNPSKPLLPELLAVKTKIEETCNIILNSVLLNLYRNGNDSVSFHQDRERGMGTNPIVASVSLGAERLFKLKNLKTATITSIKLETGSLLIMGNMSQINYVHSLPKTKENVGERINLTFRYMI